MNSETKPVRLGTTSVKLRQKKSKASSAKTPEGQVKEKVKAILNKFNAWWFMPSTFGFGRSGVPDIIACVNGTFFGIEVKSNKTTHPVTTLQQRELDAIELAGGVAVVVDEDGLASLEETIRQYADLPFSQEQLENLVNVLGGTNV